MPPREFLLYYAGGLFLLIAILFWRRPKRGMILRLGRGKYSAGIKKLKPDWAHDNAVPRLKEDDQTINVMFNFNGHSWDAYEVFGIPAGSSLPTVEAAYRDSLNRVDESSRAFLHAAFKAIEANHKSRRASGQ